MNEILNDIEANEVVERNNLAVVAKVAAVEPIPGKDRIELVYLEDVGFTFICEKGHQVGDLVVYIKYDSIVPDCAIFEFMRDSKFRVKQKAFTERDEEDNIIKKIYSQGIIVTLDTVEEYLTSKFKIYSVKNVTHLGDGNFSYDVDIDIDGNYQTFTIQNGADMTELIGVKKYIPPVQGGGTSLGKMQSKGNFPTHLVSKTDELNGAAKIHALEELKFNPVVVTKKLDGSSFTALLDPETGELQVCSRNNNLRDVEGNKFWQVARKYNLQEVMKQYPNVAIQGN